jgi:DNA-binding NtrC family response regulator
MRMHNPDEWIAESRVMREMMGVVARIAEAADATVLIQGACGVGKTVLASLIHLRTPGRAGQPFVTIECGASGEQLLQEQLFGPGLPQEPTDGLLGPSNHGTIVLREVGQLTSACQGRLVQAIDRTTHGDLGRAGPRVIATSTVDVVRLVRAGVFRTDLYNRLATIQIRHPTLRERVGDLAPLTDHFLARVSRRIGTALELSPAAAQYIASHDFAGNVRELRTLVEDAALDATKGVVEISRSSYAETSDDRRRRDPFFEVAIDAAGRPPKLRELERDYAERVLRYVDGNRTHTARLLGVSYPTLLKKLRANQQAPRE